MPLHVPDAEEQQASDIINMHTGTDNTTAGISVKAEVKSEDTDRSVPAGHVLVKQELCDDTLAFGEVQVKPKVEGDADFHSGSVQSAADGVWVKQEKDVDDEPYGEKILKLESCGKHVKSKIKLETETAANFSSVAETCSGDQNMQGNEGLCGGEATRGVSDKQGKCVMCVVGLMLGSLICASIS